MDNLIFCLNATVPIFAIILLGRLLRGRNFFQQTDARGDRQAVVQGAAAHPAVPRYRRRAHHRAVQREVLLFLCRRNGALLFAIWAGAALFLRDKSMVGAFTQGAFRGSQAILGVAFVQNLYGDAGLVPLMIVASVPLYNIFSVLVLTVTAPDRARQTITALSGARCAASSPTDHPRHSRRSAVFRCCRSTFRRWRTSF